MYAYEIKNIKKKRYIKTGKCGNTPRKESIPHALKSSVSNSRVTNV